MIHGTGKIRWIHSTPSFYREINVYTQNEEFQFN